MEQCCSNRFILVIVKFPLSNTMYSASLSVSLSVTCHYHKLKSIKRGSISEGLLAHLIYLGFFHSPIFSVAELLQGMNVTFTTSFTLG